MTAIAAYARLRSLGVPVVSTFEAAAVLGMEGSAAGKTLARLARAGLIVRIRHGQWGVEETRDPLRLVPSLLAPWDAYASMQTALHLHGMIEQIPVVTYAATLGRTQRVRTPVGVLSFHHVAPELYGGYDERFVASPEKALFDVAWLSQGKTRLFAGLPELELPAGFRLDELDRWIGRIRSARGRTMARRRLEGWLTKAVRERGGRGASAPTR